MSRAHRPDPDASEPEMLTPDFYQGEDPVFTRRFQKLVERSNMTSPYEIVVGHETLAGTALSNESVLTQYAHLTDSLIFQLCALRAEAVVFLDKSARPVSWLVSAFWPFCAGTYASEGSTGTFTRGIPKPRFHYLNIDREQWRSRMDTQGVGRFEVGSLEQELFTGLRRSLLSTHGSTASEARVWKSPTFLTGKRVVVVDEVRVSGDTLQIAAALIGRAVPDCDIDVAHWMTPSIVTRSGNRFNNQVPVWYRDATAFGRLVGDRDPTRASSSANWRTRAAAWFISMPHDEPDELGIRLRNEAQQLAADALTGRVKLVPCFDRPDAEERAALFTSMSLRELRDWREKNSILLRPSE